MSEVSLKQESNILNEFLYKAIKLPGVKISRNEFLKKTLSKHFSLDVVERAIKDNPAKAGITVHEIDKISKACINYETSKVTALSAAAGLPGKFGMVAAVPADIAQYFAHVIRIMQKLIYLYGWDDLFEDKDNIDDATLLNIQLFIGVMFGVEAANKLISKVAANVAVRAKKKIPEIALTKGMIYPIVKKIAASINIKLNKQMFANGIAKIIPFIGAVLSGGLTYASFKPMSKRLKNHLKGLPIADVSFYKNESNLKNIDKEIKIDINDFDDVDFEIYANDLAELQANDLGVQGNDMEDLQAKDLGVYDFGVDDSQDDDLY